ncbi:AraC family transcriptional regulator [Paenibacillus sp. J5C_2022]|uniref:helix-turn-helix transcriptional regulator n=1 Tax=Paenibacillus sp. J5C2022 TaxID=2977129 RepID=UPI0021D02135|nr:AraC family transcriptional regulator [Paenibacillus sp. J5C2022]MCU6712903.1 AraC family transcriptional regulator [Paenibacillus sp. J5C2022]
MIKWGRSRLFKTYFLSYVMVVAIITSLLGLTLMQLISHAVRSELAEVSSNRLAYADSIIKKSILEPSEKMVHQHMFLNYNTKLKGAFSHYELHKYLSEQSKMIPYIESFSVYYPAERIMISSNQIKYDFEPEWIGEQMAGNRGEEWHTDYIPTYANQKDRELIRYTKPSVVKGADQRPVFYLSVSVYKLGLQNTLASQQVKPNEIIAIINEQDDVIAYSAYSPNVNGLVKVALDKSKEKAVSFGVHQEMMFATSYDSHSQWHYVLMMPLSDFFQILYSIRNTILMVTATILILGMLMSLVAAVIHWLPVQRVIDDMKNTFGNEGNVHHEFKFMQEGMKKLCMTVSDLRMKENTHMIGKLLHGVMAMPYDDRIYKLMPLERYVVIVVSSRNENTVDQMEEWAAVWKINHEAPENYTYVLPYQKEIAAVLLNFAGDFAQLSTQMRQSLQLFASQRNLSIRVGIGSPEEELMDVHVSCANGVKALQQHFLLPEAPVSIAFDELQGLQDFSLQEGYRELNAALRNNDRTGVQAAFKHMEASLRSGRFQYESVENIMSRIFPVVACKLQECDRKAQVATEFYSHATIFDALAWLEDLVAGTMLSTTEVNATDAIMERVKAYIDEQFTEELSLELLSQKTFISASYISTVFKKTYGVGVSEYISNLRLNEACRLLAGSPYKVAEIAEMIGMPNIPYFITRFKKQFGQTPNQYRRERVMVKLESSPGKG